MVDSLLNNSPDLSKPSETPTLRFRKHMPPGSVDPQHIKSLINPKGCTYMDHHICKEFGTYAFTGSDNVVVPVNIGLDIHYRSTLKGRKTDMEQC